MRIKQRLKRVYTVTYSHLDHALAALFLVASPMEFNWGKNPGSCHVTLIWVLEWGILSMFNCKVSWSKGTREKGKQTRLLERDGRHLLGRRIWVGFYTGWEYHCFLVASYYEFPYSSWKQNNRPHCSQTLLRSSHSTRPWPLFAWPYTQTFSHSLTIQLHNRC